MWGGGYKLCICPITFSLLEIMHQNVPNMFVIQVQGTLCNKERREDSSTHFYIKSCLNNIKEIIIILMIYINCGCFFQSLVSPTKAKQMCRISSEIVAT